MNVEIYKEMRNKFMPKKIKAIFILESPPSNGGYFYNTNGKVSEILFRSFMEVLFNIKPNTKEAGLKQFSEEGFLLVNPIYTPINKIPDKKADEMILENYPNFVDDLKGIMKNNLKTPIILVKSNICKILEGKMLNNGFNVINKGAMIPFPMHYHFKDFSEKIKILLNAKKN